MFSNSLGKKANDGAKFILARLLSTENIQIRIDPTIKTAAFDTKRRVLLLPVWNDISDELYDMLLVHETGHAIDTAPSDWETGLESLSSYIAKKFSSQGVTQEAAKQVSHGYLNVIEDARIDKRQQRRYPGSRKDYSVGYKELHTRDFFGLVKNKKNIQSLPFIDKFNLYFKGGFDLGINFNPIEKNFIARGEALETWADVEVLAKDMVDYESQQSETMQDMLQQIQDFQDAMEKARKAGGKMKFDSKEEFEKFLEELSDVADSGVAPEEVSEAASIDIEVDGMSKEEIDSALEEALKGNSSDADDGDKETDGTEGEAEDSNSDKKTSSKKISHATPHKPSGKTFSGKVPVAPTTQAELDKALNARAGTTGRSVVYAAMPHLDYEKAIVKAKDFLEYYSKDTRSKDDDKNKYEAWRKSEADVIGMMAKEFEMKKAADLHKRTVVARTGILDTNKIHKYRFTDDIFRRQNIVTEGKNHGFVMFIDWSGSMQGILHQTMLQVMRLVLFCKRVNIPFEVYTFQSKYNGEYRNSIRRSSLANNLQFHPAILVNLTNSRLNALDFQSSMHAMWSYSLSPRGHMSLGDTPLDYTVLASTYIVNAFRAKNKLQIPSVIILSDGASNATSIPGVNYYNSGGTTDIMVEIDRGAPPVHFDTNSGYSGMPFTFDMVRWAKQATGANYVGFFLTDTVDLPFKEYMDKQEIEQAKNVWRSDRFATIKSLGYDQYHFMSVLAQQNALTTAEKAMARGEVPSGKALENYGKTKKASRAILKAFIDQIS